MGIAIQRSAMAPFVVMLLLSYDIDTASSEGIASSTAPVSSNTTAPVHVPTSKPSSSSMQPSVPDEDINLISAVPTISSVDEEEPHCVDMLWANYQLLGADVPITPGYLYGLNYCKDFSSEVICEAFGHTEYAVYDDPIFDASLTHANATCCMCGGGKRSAQQCYDNPEYRTIGGFDCFYYNSYWEVVNASARKGNDEIEIDCQEIKFSYIDGINSSVANEHCCICGGGQFEPYENTSGPPDLEPAEWIAQDEYLYENCVDIRAWQDPISAFGCPWYLQSYADVFRDYPEADFSSVPDLVKWSNDLNVTIEYLESVYPIGWADEFYFQSFRNGYNINNACCHFGGGVNITRNFTDIENHDGVSCIDYPGYMFFDATNNMEYTCMDAANYEELFGGFCESYGQLVGSNGRTTQQSCCNCGGGYKGPLNGHQMRVKFPADADAKFSLYTEEDNFTKRGSIYEFLKLVAKANNFGMYSRHITVETNSTSTSMPYASPTSMPSASPSILPTTSQTSNENSPVDTYDECSAEMQTLLGDLCIGPYHNTSRVGYTAGLLSSKPLFFDEFFLVVPTREQTFWQILVTPFGPFHWTAWIAIFFVTVTTGIVLNIIQTGEVFSKRKKNVVARLFQTLYESAMACAGGGAKISDNPKMPEKIVAASFALFVLVTVAAYTATSAAVLVAGIPPVFESLSDVEKESSNRLCVDYKVEDILIRNHPSTEGIIFPVDWSTAKILQNVGIADSKPCDAAVVTKDAFNVATYSDKSGICDKVTLLTGEVIMTVPNVIFFSPLYGKISTDFIENVNMMIDVGEYKSFHEKLRDQFEMELGGDEKCFEVDNDDGDDVSLTWRHLLSPLILSMLGSVVALFLHTVTRTRVLQESERLFGVIHEGKDADIILRKRVENMTAVDLLTEITELGISQDQISSAINELPDKRPLINLLFRKKCSQYSSQVNFVSEMLSIYELYVLSLYCTNHIVFDGSLDLVLEEKSPKDKIVEVLLENERTNEVVISAARAKRDNNGDFNIEKYVAQSLANVSANGGFGDPNSSSSIHETLKGSIDDS